MESKQDGERLARIETRQDHYKEEQGSIKSELAAHEQDMRDFKEGMFQLRASSEALLKSVETAHARIDHVDKAIETMDKRVDTLNEDFQSLKQRVTMIISVGAGCVSVFWAVFGSSVQGLVGSFFGH